MSRWFHPTRICPKHGVPLLVTRSGVVFCAVSVDDARNPNCIYEVPGAAPTRIPKEVRLAMQRVRKRTRKKLRKLLRDVKDPTTELGAAVAYFKQKKEKNDGGDDDGE